MQPPWHGVDQGVPMPKLREQAWIVMRTMKPLFCPSSFCRAVDLRLDFYLELPRLPIHPRNLVGNVACPALHGHPATTVADSLFAVIPSLLMTRHGLQQVAV